MMRFLINLLFFSGNGASFARTVEKLWFSVDLGWSDRELVNFALGQSGAIDGLTIESLTNFLVEGTNEVRALAGPAAAEYDALISAVQDGDTQLQLLLDETGAGASGQVADFRAWADAQGYPGDGVNDQLGDLFAWAKAQTIT